MAELAEQHGNCSLMTSFGRYAYRIMKFHYEGYGLNAIGILMSLISGLFNLHPQQVSALPTKAKGDMMDWMILACI